MKSKRPLETVSIYLLLAIVGFFAADLTILSFRDRILPSVPPPAKNQRIAAIRRPDRETYNVVLSRNIFNADQKIPDPIGGNAAQPERNADPIPSSLPLQLVGTIVHANPYRSIATVNLRNKNEQVPVKVNGVIPDNLATVTKIERNRVIFRNNMTQILEFIEMKENAKISFGASQPKPSRTNGDVLQRGEGEFELKRDTINRLTSNLGDLLQQATAVPRMGRDGQIECFNIANIQSGSIFEQFGIQKGDCIKSVNGERIDSPAKAMELYNALRGNASNISLGIERGGRDENFNYTITN